MGQNVFFEINALFNSASITGFVMIFDSRFSTFPEFYRKKCFFKLKVKK